MILRGPQCPVDREPLTRQNIFPNKFTERKILSLAIKCPHQVCKWKGELRDIESHESRCAYKVVNCDNKSCKVRKPRCLMVRHVQEECQYRMVPCHHCKNSYTFCLLEKHTSNCPKCPVSCPNHCEKTMRREDVASHLSDECPLTNVPCSYQSIGCTFEEHREDLDEHIENHVKQHLNIAVEKIISLQEQMDEMKNQITLSNQHLQTQMDKMKILSANVMTKEDEGCLSYIWEIKNLNQLRGTAVSSAQPVYAQSAFSAPFYEDEDRNDEEEGWIAKEEVYSEAEEEVYSEAEEEVYSEAEEEVYSEPEEVYSEPEDVYSNLFGEDEDLSDKEEGWVAKEEVSSEEEEVLSEYLRDEEEGGVANEEVSSVEEEVFSDLFYGIAVSSTPFYTHKNGYKLMLDLSNNVITLYVMKGEYDDTLTWPFYVEQVSFFQSHHDQRAQQGNSVGGLYSDGRSPTGFQKPQDANVPIATCDLRRQSQYMAVFGGGQLNTQNYIPNDTLLLKLEIVLSCNRLSYRQLDSQLV